ncbi:ankyrin repeat-containing domain protein [Aspergillus varians]
MGRRNLLDLPNEIIFCIFSHVTTETLAKLTRVSRQCHEIAAKLLYTLDDKHALYENEIIDGAPRFELRDALEEAAHTDGEALMLRILKGSMKAIKLSPARQFDALLYSCTYGLEAAVRVLLDAGIPPDPAFGDVEDKWTTPLTGAIYEGHTAIIKMLLDAGANLKRYPFDHTLEIIWRAPKETVGELIRGLDLTLLDDKGHNLLHGACDEEHCSAEHVTLLLDNGLDPNHLSSIGQTPIALSIYRSLDSRREEAEILAILLRRYPKIADSLCDGDFYPIHVACAEGSPTVVQLLLFFGADPNRQNITTGETPLGSLAGRESQSALILVALLDAGASLSTHAPSTEEYLTMAIRKGWVESLKLLYCTYRAQVEKLRCYDLIFLGAVVLGDIAMLHTIASRGLVNVNSNTYGTTPLIEACRHGKEPVVRFLVNEANVSNFDQPDRDGITALHAAIQHGSAAERIIKFLLPHLITFPNIPGAGYHFPLGDAVFTQSVEVVSLLIEKWMQWMQPALSKARPGDDISALFRAVREEEQVPQALLEDLASALIVAIQEDDDQMLELLIDRIQQMGLSESLPYGPTFEAIDGRHFKAAHMLVDNKIALESLHTSFTPLMCAICNGDIAIARKLIGHGVDLEVEAEDGTTALKTAAAMPGGDATIVRELLPRVNVNAGIEDGEAAIDEAVKSNNAPAVHLLMAAGARACSQLLHIAAILDTEDTLKALLVNGLDVNTPGESDLESPLFRAAFHGRTRNVHLLLQMGAGVNQVSDIGRGPLGAAVLGGDVRAVEMLLEAGAEIEHADKNGNTPLILASRVNHTEIMGLLVYCGANVNRRSYKGWSALGVAVANKNVDAVRLLLIWEADYAIQVPGRSEHETRSLLHLAVQSRQAGIVQLLVDAGCDRLATDSLGKTPLELAVDDEVLAALYSGHPAGNGSSFANS